MSETHFVIIHGLASKPPHDVLARRYRKYLGESLGFDLPAERVHTVYWADLMGYDPPDRPEEDEYVEGADNFEPYSFLEMFKFEFKGLLRNQFVDLVEAKIERALSSPKLEGNVIGEVVAALPEFFSAGPSRKVYGRFLPDLHRYFFGDSRELVRDRLRHQLQAIPTSASVCLIAHSMGSIIAADVLIADRIPLDTLITIGSPLGLQIVQEQIAADSTAKQQLQLDVKQWFNLYDRLDVVALDTDIADDFSPMPVLDIQVLNEFVNKQGERNHHKSYGYLRCKELGEIVAGLVGQDEPT